MNAKKFEAFQRAADIELLEEAQTAPKRSGGWQKFVLTAACLCVVASAAAVWQPWNTSSKKTGDQSQLPGPWSDTTIENIRAMGFDMVLPDGAEDITFTALNAGENGADMVEADYTLGGVEYTCRAAKRSESEDISGLYETWDQNLSWTVGEAQLQMCTNHLTGYVSWFLPEEGQQWCESSSSSDARLLENAKILAAGLGQELATAPEGAENVVISVFSQDGRTVAETAFTISGARWTYRTAPGDLDLVDISGLDDCSTAASGSVGYCSARLSYDEGGAGKIIWFDIVPGVEYSLSVESGASEDSLIAMANELFSPLQGEAG